MKLFSRSYHLSATLPLVATLLLHPGAADARQPATARAVRSEAPASVGVVNLNTASLDQLQLLPGIGPSKGQAIIKYRLKNPFKSTFQLVSVRGIGRKTYRKLRPYLAVTGPTTLQAKVRAGRSTEQ